MFNTLYMPLFGAPVTPAEAPVLDPAPASAPNEADKKAKQLQLQLEEYLAEAPRALNVDLGAYWRSKRKEWPDLYRMARQYCAIPATTSAVERTFTLAGRMHDDFRKSTLDSTLELDLMIAANTDRSVPAHIETFDAPTAIVLVE